MGCATWVSASVTTLMTVAPATIVFENWLFYEYPTAVLLVLSALVLAGFVRTRSFWSGFWFFMLLAAVIWTRSVFQIVWFLLALALVLVALRDHRKVVLRAAVVPLLLVVALYAKNIAVFGLPNTSSWFGMNLARMVFKSISPTEREQWVAKGRLSRVSLVEPFSHVEAYRGIIPLSRPTGIPVLDQTILPRSTPNMNNKSYLRISDAYLSDSLRSIRHEPYAYLRSIKSSLMLTFLPSLNYGFVAANRTHIQSYAEVFNRVVYLQTPWAARMGLGIFAAYAFALLYGLRVLVLWIRGRRSTDPVLVTLLYAWLTVSYVLVILAFTSGFENQRIRFVVDPFVVVLVAGAIREAWPAVRKRVNGQRVRRQPSPA
jgi:hypothetical protein